MTGPAQPPTDDTEYFLSAAVVTAIALTALCALLAFICRVS
jgi:hypothetical protein